MAFRLKVYIVVPLGLNIDGLKSFFQFIFISIYNSEIHWKLLNLSLIVYLIHTSLELVSHEAIII